VVEVSPRLNRAKGTATVKVRFEAIPPELRPEMSARVNFLAKPLSEADKKAAPTLVVPAGAIVRKGGDTFVWTVDGEKVRRSDITLGAAKGSDFILLTGPAAGTKVIKDPPATLAEGAPVKEKTK
jgi:hypothetical protein